MKTHTARRRMTWTRTMTWTLLAFLVLRSAPAAAQAPEPATETERTLSPYFLIRGGADDSAAFPLESTAVDVQVSGVIADVTVRQTYRNAGPSPIEAVYVFPASTRAAVHGLRMTLGDRMIEAVVKERAEARRTYEESRSAGKTASLLEQQRPNVFQMNVANILPGDRIDIELRYTELLVPEHGVYELVYPTVVGPRYSTRPADGAPAEHRWVLSPYLRRARPSPSRFSIAVSLDGGLPLQDVGSPSHAIDVRYSDPTRTNVELHAGETDPANRDFILRYRLQDGRIQTGLLLGAGAGDASVPRAAPADEGWTNNGAHGDEPGRRAGTADEGTPEDGAPGEESEESGRRAGPAGSDERFFLLMVQPPRGVRPADVPPREYVFVVDVSGSMNGFPLEVSKRLMRGLLQGLRPQDTFNVVLFAGASAVMAPRSVTATPDRVQAAMNVIDAQQGGGGTELLRALDTALNLPESGQARSIVILTDGYVDVESEAFERIRENAGRASVFAFGIGSSVNRFLIEGLAHAGQGEPFIVTGPEAAEPAVQRFLSYVEAPLLTDVEIDWGELDAYDVEPRQVPILMAERPLIVSGKWRGRARGSVVVRGRRGAEEWSAAVALDEAAARMPSPALGYLWARTRLRRLSDFAGLEETAALRDQVVALGLRYNMLTRHTSFVAVDHEVRNPSGTSDTVKQPLPLPQGVSEMAVGAPGTPEPATWILLALAGGAAARHLRKKNRPT